jgi:kinesin family protein 16B
MTQLKNMVFSQKDEIQKYEKELTEKNILLMESSQKIGELDRRLAELESENERLLRERSQTELEEVQRKKQA